MNDELIGKYYELLDYEGDPALRIKINFVKERENPSDPFNDGSCYPINKQILVSEDGNCWYGIRESKFERIVDNDKELESDRTSEVGVSLPKQWQKCPLCNGDGIIAVPILETVNSTHQICSVCNGKKIILMG